MTLIKAELPQVIDNCNDEFLLEEAKALLKNPGDKDLSLPSPSF